MIKLRDILLLSALLVSAIQAKSQEKTNYKHLQDIVIGSVDYTNYSKESFSKNGGDGDARFREMKASLYFPIYSDNNNRLRIMGGAIFSHLNLDLSNLRLNASNQANINMDRDFYSYGSELLMIKKLGTKNWKSIMKARGFMASDMKSSISSDDFYYSLAAIFSKRKSKNFEYGFGFIFGNEFGGTKIFPIFTANYRKNNWETNISLPIHAAQYYRFEKFKVGFSYDMARTIYSVDNDFGSNLGLDKIVNLKFNIGPEFEANIYKKLKLNLKSGITLGNELEWLNKDTDSVIDISPDNSYFFRLGLKYVY